MKIPEDIFLGKCTSFVAIVKRVYSHGESKEYVHGASHVSPDELNLASLARRTINFSTLTAWKKSAAGREK